MLHVEELTSPSVACSLELFCGQSHHHGFDSQVQLHVLSTSFLWPHKVSLTQFELDLVPDSAMVQYCRTGDQRHAKSISISALH